MSIPDIDKNLLNKEVYDYDFATDATPSEISEFVRNANTTFAKYGNTRIKLNGRTVDITTFRKENSYPASRHPNNIEFVRDIKIDSLRRDFTINALACANKVIIPVQTQYLAARNMGQLLRTVSKVKRQINPELNVDGILLTLVDGRTNLSKDTKIALQENYGSRIKIFDTQIPIAVKIAESTVKGKSIFSYDKNNRVADAYFNFAKEVDENGKEIAMVKFEKNTNSTQNKNHQQQYYPIYPVFF